MWGKCRDLPNFPIGCCPCGGDKLGRRPWSVVRQSVSQSDNCVATENSHSARLRPPGSFHPHIHFPGPGPILWRGRHNNQRQARPLRNCVGGDGPRYRAANAVAARSSATTTTRAATASTTRRSASTGPTATRRTYPYPVQEQEHSHSPRPRTSNRSAMMPPVHARPRKVRPCQAEPTRFHLPCPVRPQRTRFRQLGTRSRCTIMILGTHQDPRRQLHLPRPPPRLVANQSHRLSAVLISFRTRGRPFRTMARTTVSAPASVISCSGCRSSRSRRHPGLTTT
jgi:hypothetical protein